MGDLDLLQEACNLQFIIEIVGNTDRITTQTAFCLEITLPSFVIAILFLKLPEVVLQLQDIVSEYPLTVEWATLEVCLDIETLLLRLLCH